MGVSCFTTNAYKPELWRQENSFIVEMCVHRQKVLAHESRCDLIGIFLLRGMGC